jgi:hypothetical protein
LATSHNEIGTASDTGLQGPGDVGIGQKFRLGEGTQALITYYEGCWISDYSVSYAADTALVQETVTINVSDIYADVADLTAAGSSDTEDDYSKLAIPDTGSSHRVQATTTV